MQRFLMPAAVLTLALATSLGGAFPPAGGTKIHKGHDLISPARMQQLKHGTHHVKTLKSGHKVHATLKGGKVANMHAVDRKGKHVAMTKRVVRRPAGGKTALNQGGGDAIALALKGTDLEGAELSPVSVQVQVIVLFVFRDPLSGQLIAFAFPAQSVVGGGGLGGNDDGGDLDGLGGLEL
jgi:hypothetical protein